jgi:hypothetical protein
VRRLPSQLVSLFGALILFGCSSETERPPGIDGGGAGTPRVGLSDGTTKYPDGPYGRKNPQVGEAIENLRLIGYRDPEDASKGSPDSFSLAELRKRGSSHLLVHVSSFWCAACRPEAYFMSRYTEEVRAAGGEVLEILIDGDVIGDDPTWEQLNTWVTWNDLQTTTAIPGDDSVREVFPDRDFVYIVDLETMKVVWRAEGPSLNPTTSEIGAEEMLQTWLSH